VHAPGNYRPFANERKGLAPRGSFNDNLRTSTEESGVTITRLARWACLLALIICGMGFFVRRPDAQVPAAPGPADLILTNGRILTVDARDSIAEAIAIAGGRIVAVGSAADMMPHTGPQTRTIDLHGRTMTPGLIDSHVHFTEADALYAIDLSGIEVTKIDDVARRVAARTAALKPGEWVRGRGWDEGKLAERRYLTASDLDKVSPGNPVWLTQTTGHYGVANSHALKMAGITRDTSDPPAGTIDRDAQGNPTGVLKEAAMDLVTRRIPQLTREQQRNGIIKIVQDFNAEGMTAAKDPGIEPEKWDLYQELLKEGKLTVRIFALWSGGRSVETARQTLARIRTLPRPPASFGDGRLLSGGVKLFMDGSGGARTAWMYADWNKNFTDKDTGNVGYPTTAPDVYREMVALLHDAGVHVSTHAIGDRAIDWVVDTYDQVLKAKPTPGLRHGIIHGNTPTDHAIAVMSRLQREWDAGYPEAQATFLWWLGDTYAGNLGPERALRLKPFHTFADQGLRWGGGSDFGVTPFPARYSLWASVARQTLNGTYGPTPFGTRESVDIRTALRSHTIWAAHQLFLDDRIGSIEVGKDADVAVWDRDLYTVPVDKLKDLRCELTLVQGQIVYQAAARDPLD
jgi:predicted amidohydrolase YtcJ